jgi:hypothetical protein
MLFEILNRESSIVNFIKDNLKLLQQQDFPEDLFKQIKHRYFFEKLKNEIGKPKDSEIAHVAIFYFIRKHMLKDVSRITKILDLPFFNDNIGNKDLYHSALRLNDPSTAVTIDPSKMDDAEYQQEISKQIKDQIISENKSLLQEQTEKYQNEIESLRKH